jgi:hypothetical protein
LWYEGGSGGGSGLQSAVQPAAMLKLASGLGTWLVRRASHLWYVMQVKTPTFLSVENMILFIMVKQ